MIKSKSILLFNIITGFAGVVFLAVFASNTGMAYDTYSGGADGGCIDCHGDFRSSASTKGTIFPKGKNHDMHRDLSYMATACDLCHNGTSHKPVFTGFSNGTTNSNGTVKTPGLGCTGCHMAEGLRAHHAVNGITECFGCHVLDGPPPAETVKPPYFGTTDTKANNPGNTVLATNINENWSVGDYLGLDNDGNNLYDLADYAVGPFKILSTIPVGNNVSIQWLTAGGRTDKVQAAGTVSGAYANVSSAIVIPGVGLVTNTFVEVNGATNNTRFYRMSGAVP